MDSGVDGLHPLKIGDLGVVVAGQDLCCGLETREGPHFDIGQELVPVLAGVPVYAELLESLIDECCFLAEN